MEAVKVKGGSTPPTAQMRFKGLNFSSRSIESVRKEFYGEYIRRRDLALLEKDSLLEKHEFLQSEEAIKLCASIKLELIDEWERKGRNMSFLDKSDTFDHLLYQKHYGRTGN